MQKGKQKKMTENIENLENIEISTTVEENLSPSSEEPSIEEQLPVGEEEEYEGDATDEIFGKLENLNTLTEGEGGKAPADSFTDLYPDMLWEYFKALKYTRLQIEDQILKMAEERKDENPLYTLLNFLPVETLQIGMGRVKTKHSERKSLRFYNLKDVLSAYRFEKKAIEDTNPWLYVNEGDLKNLKEMSFRGFKKRPLVNTVKETIEETKEEDAGEPETV